MSTAVFPTLTGQGWNVTRTPLWQTRKPVSIAGKETAIADWSYPRHRWELVFDVLRQGSVSGTDYTEMQQLFGFFNARQGGFDSFLYQDADDNAVTGEILGTGDGSTTTFQLVRSFGGFIEPVLAPNFAETFNVYLDGALQPGASYTKYAWDAASPNSPGTIVFGVAPTAGQQVKADFSFYWPVRFDVDECAFDKFAAGFYEVKKLSFMSIK